ncbi:cobalamin biosynthesis protein CobT [Motiliproteus coralliicola]|uniref:Cobalamin biosynthesis protein CobT n=1 Tax=Motiliproteus coralliicola TaxID=2283196 RepID=A0A369WCS4_9GAMM|nr:cobalamin biosynthesis protein CobT [Motiliproteus coralliicola]RDE19427.1 cobalamin biosynthesis protein CobT [Motiliproteus coralliicola]
MTGPLVHWGSNTTATPQIKVEQPRKEKRQQRLEELCAATIRALTGNPRLRYRGHRLEQDGRRVRIRAPHLYTDVTEDDFDSFRGAADGLALRLIHSDAELHASLMPEKPLEQTLFEILEQLRAEAQVSDDHPGIRRNLKHRFVHWCLQYHQSGMTENQVGLMLFTVIQSAWSRLTGYPTLEETEGLIEPQRAVLAPHIGTDLLGLRRQRHDQAAFAQHALGIGRELSSIIEAGQPSGDDDDERDSSDIAENTNFSLILEEDDDNLDGLDNHNAVSRTQTERELSEALSQYKVFSREFDRELSADKIVRLDQRRTLREQLDKRIKRQGINVPRLSRQIARALAAPRLDGWRFGEEEGRLDARRLSRLVTSPAERRVFRQEQRLPHTDAQVCFLIDNSGSMKEHIESICMLVDVLSRAFEQCGARSEVLGFTTGSWNGGKPFKQWRGRGCPANPGRLSEVSHIVYKDAELSWRRARANIAALLKPTLFREGIDGEALQWAAGRLQSSSANRKILIVISDGCPMDSMTAQHNPPDYLDHHLQQVAGSIELGGQIELMALGVGLDLSRYYRRSLAMDLSQSMDNALFYEVVDLLASRR